jgi:hypothetical protein
VSPPARASLDGLQPPDGGPHEGGELRFSRLEPRTYRLKVQKAGYETQVRSVSVPEGRTTVVEITLQPAP